MDLKASALKAEPRAWEEQFAVAAWRPLPPIVPRAESRCRGS